MRDRPSGPERAQTMVDFAIGTVVFLLAAGAAVSMIPSLVDPAVGQDPANAVIADRIADQLTHDVLTSPGNPYVLNGSAATAFFDDGPAAVHDRLAIDDSVGLNITLTTETGTLSVGPTPPQQSDSVYPARRVVVVDGTQQLLRVSVW